jgi:carbon storage regulator CsrA
MLVLQRNEGQWIDIGKDISICVIRVRDNKVRIGILAPPNVEVNRREVTELRAARKFMEKTAEGGTQP